MKKLFLFLGLSAGSAFAHLLDHTHTGRLMEDIAIEVATENQDSEERYFRGLIMAFKNQATAIKRAMKLDCLNIEQNIPACDCAERYLDVEQMINKVIVPYFNQEKSGKKISLAEEKEMNKFLWHLNKNFKKCGIKKLLMD